MAPNSSDINRIRFERTNERKSDHPKSKECQKSEMIELKQPQSAHSSMMSIISSYLFNSMFKFKILRLFSSIRYYIKRIYVLFWHELSMDPAVKSISSAEPIEHEVLLSWNTKFNIRRRRLFFILIHILGIMGVFYCLSGRVKLYTILWTLLLGMLSSIGVTAGAHRLWSHHSYKATWQLRVILMVFQTIAVQYSLYNWARDHRLHHKYTDTDADPHNSNRGFFFSHIGWSVILPHPEVIKKLKTIDMKDIEQDKVAMFQYKYYVPLSLLLSYVIPTLVPWYFWNEDLWVSHVVAAQFRHVITLHGTFLINSAAHMWGTKPYDKNINPTENMFVSVTSFGDGWHNYHHVFPWDYRNAELWNYKLNLSTAFVDLFALIGWAYDLKTVPSDIVSKRVKRTGDGSHHVWGWNDIDLPIQDKQLADIRHKKKE